MNHAFMVELLQRKLKDTNEKKRPAWAKKHEQWTLDWWKSVFFWMSVFVRHRVGERMIPACVGPTMKHGGGGAMVCGCFAGETVSELF